jgi:hypothetical protein
MEPALRIVLVVAILALLYCLHTKHAQGANSPYTSVIAGRTPHAPKKQPCAPGLRDDGTSCWNDSYTPGPHMTKQKCETSQPLPCEKLGVLWYPICLPAGRALNGGYKRVGLTCQPLTGGGIKQTLFQRIGCAPNQDMIGGMCYDKK